LNKRDSYPDQMPATAARAASRGILHPDLAATRFQVTRSQPHAGLATILPHPNVNLAFEAHGAGIYGVDRQLFTRVLTGRGLVFGVRFRPGCFRSFWQAPISQLTDRVVPAARLFGPRAELARQAIMRAGAGAWSGSAADTEMIAHAEALLDFAQPERDPAAERVAAVVASITADPALRRVDQLAAVTGMTSRSLQRLFADYLGVSPKWVMRRARLHEAAERADSGEQVDWAELAADLGYADQAHLTRDFTVTIGISPARYASPVTGS
jgi:AraC-like DNA-binding protein